MMRSAIRIDALIEEIRSLSARGGECVVFVQARGVPASGCLDFPVWAASPFDPTRGCCCWPRSTDFPSPHARSNEDLIELVCVSQVRRRRVAAAAQAASKAFIMLDRGLRNGLDSSAALTGLLMRSRSTYLALSRYQPGWIG